MSRKDKGSILKAYVKHVSHIVHVLSSLFDFNLFSRGVDFVYKLNLVNRKDFKLFFWWRCVLEMKAAKVQNTETLFEAGGLEEVTLSCKFFQVACDF